MPQPSLSAASSGMSPASGRPRGGWDDATVEVLIRLWSDGDLSASVIARRLGVTRNAVLGKVHRLGLSNRRPGHGARAPAPSRAPRRLPAPRVATPRRPKARTAPRLTARAEASPSPPDARREELPGLVAHLEDLPPRTCHWPSGDPTEDGFCFCGRDADPGPYCPVHNRLAHRTRPARPLKGLAALLDA